jgi:hypothetical protein
MVTQSRVKDYMMTAGIIVALVLGGIALNTSTHITPSSTTTTPTHYNNTTTYHNTTVYQNITIYHNTTNNITIYHNTTTYNNQTLPEVNVTGVYLVFNNTPTLDLGNNTTLFSGNIAFPIGTTVWVNFTINETNKMCHTPWIIYLNSPWVKVNSYKTGKNNTTDVRLLIGVPWQETPPHTGYPIIITVTPKE